MRWSSQRRPAGFNLAFLDIMACGLGAIILIFMLVKYNSGEPSTESNALANELAGIRKEIQTISANNDALAAQIEKLKQQLQQEIQRSVRSDEEAGATVEELIKLTKEIAALEQKLAQQKQQAEAPEQKETESVKDKTQEDHLIGLRVTGPRILILLDNSASMADERLLDIVKIKAADTAAKKAAPKWRRAIAVTHWILDRVPEDSEYMVMHYNATADFLPDKKWRKVDDGSARAAVSQALEKLYPREATNLHSALKLIKTSSIRPTDIYVITDSLPTKGPGSLSALRRIKECGVGAAGKTNVSGKCRLALFYAAIQSFSKSSATVNTVLLPIEGDPDAAYAYWLWAATTTGMMISPAGSWP